MRIAIVAQNSNIPSSEDTLMTKLLRFNAWPEKELEILQKEYRTKTVNELRILLPTRSKCAIINKAFKLGLNKKSSDITSDGWKTRKLHRIEKRFNKPFGEIYKELREHGQTHGEIANALEIDCRTLARYLNRVEVIQPIKSNIRKVNTVFHFTKEESAYLAGLLDGDGTITINKLLRPKARLGYTYSKKVSIGNTNLKIINYVAKLTGLRVNPPKIKVKGKPEYSLGVYGYDSVIAFLEPLLPFLIGKRGRAELMIEFCKSRIETLLILTREGKSHYSEKECGIAEELRRLTKREGHPNPPKMEVS